ncbi:MAG: hypothetical protein JRJ78_17165, partial [Deltaproteobacteria bacterium]|nr:hypothetical protein [Deltaproteobacteria bacterium]
AKAAIEGGAEAKRALAKADMLGNFPVRQAELQGRASAARRMGEVEGLVPRLSDYGFEPMDILAPSFGTPFSENLRRRRILAEETGKNEAQRGISRYTTLADYINPLPEDARFDTMENLGMKVPYKERARRAEDLARKTRAAQQAERIPPYVQTALKVIATFAKKTAPRSGLDMLIMSNPKAIEDPRIQRLFGGTTLAPEDKIALDRARTIVMGYLGSHQKTPSVDEFKKKYGLD